MADANELRRIYSLKSEGLSQLLSDINQITAAFEASAKAKASLVGGGIVGYDASSLGAINSKLGEMVDIQNDLLSAVKNFNPEIAKASAGTRNYTKATSDSANSMMDMSESAKSLGSNLSGVTGGLLKTQAVMTVRNPNDYSDAIQILSSNILVLQENISKIKIGFSELQYELKSDLITTKEYEQRQENLNVKLYQTGKQLGENVMAMNALNGAYNPAITKDFTLAVQQENEALMLNAKFSKEAFTNATILGIRKKGFNEGVKQSVYIGSGQQASDEESIIEKMLAEHELYQTKLSEIDDKIEQKSNVAALERTVNEQQALEKMLAEHELYQTKLAEIQDKIDERTRISDLNKLVNQEANTPQNLASKKVNQQQTRTDVEMIKNQSIALDEQAGHMQRLAADINVLRIAYRGLTKEQLDNAEIGGVINSKALQLDNELRAYNKTVGDSTRDIGKYGLAIAGVGNITQMFTRQLIRAVGTIIIWQVLFESITKVATTIKEAIPGTDDYIKKQDALRQANEQLVESFNGITDAIEKEIKALDLLGLYEDKTSLGVDNKIKKISDENKAYIDLLKAKGYKNGNVGESELSIFNATNEAREHELDLLKSKLDISKELLKVVDKSESSIDAFKKLEIAGFPSNEVNYTSSSEATGTLKGIINNAKIPKETKDGLFVQIDKFIKDAGDAMSDVDKLKGKTIDLKPLFEKIKKELLLDNSTIQEAINKNNNEDKSSKTEFVQKEYLIAYNKRVELEKQLLGVKETFRQLNEVQDINSVEKIANDVKAKYELMYLDLEKSKEDFIKNFVHTGTKENENEYKKAINLFGSILGYEKNSEFSDINNKQQSFLEQSSSISLSEKTKELQDKSSNSSFNSSYGQANYGSMRKAIEDEENSKKQSIENEYANEKASYIKNGDDISHLQEQKNEKIIQVDKEMYKKRLSLGIDYFKKLTENADSASAIALTQIDTNTLNLITKVIKGKGSQSHKDKLIDKLQKSSIINKANEDIYNATNDEHKVAQYVDEAKGNLNDAEKSGNIDKIAEAQKAYNVILKEQADLLEKIAKAQNDKANAEQKSPDYKNENAKKIKDGFIDVAQTLSDSYFQLLEKQDAYRHEMVERSLAWNQKVQESEVQSDNERLAESKANFIAQQELDKQKAQQDRKRAEQQIVVNAVIGASKALVDAVDPIQGVIDAGIILAQAGIQEAFLAQAPAYAQGTHPGGWAFVGDGNEHELLKFGNKVGVSPNRSTLMNLPKGTNVIPFSDLGASLKAPRFVSSSSSGNNGNFGGNNEVHEKAIHSLYGIVGRMGEHLSNMNIIYDAKKANNASRKLNYKTNSI